MISVDELKKKAQNKYYAYLQAKIAGNNIFPLTMYVNKSIPRKYTDILQALGQLIASSKTKIGYGYSLELTERQTRKYGLQTIPTRIFFETETDYLKFIKKQHEVDTTCNIIQQITTQFPELETWTYNNIKKIIKNLSYWPDLIKVLDYFKDNPVPKMYIRELPIAVHTKFIELHKAMLQELLNILIADHIDAKQSKFEDRFNLKSNEPLIRLRRLDINIDNQIFSLSDDLALPLSILSNVQSSCELVIFTENLMNFLTLPPLVNTLAIWGQGFNILSLKDVSWLRQKKILYWGDIDEHGFQILSLMREIFTQAKSVMMDKKTFHTFEKHITSGKNAGKVNTCHLTADELKVYELICNNNYRLEQEKITQEYSNNELLSFYS